MTRSKVIYIGYLSLFAVVYFLAVAGYMLAGEPWYDAGYYAVQMFLVDFSPVDQMNPLIYVCRGLCPLMTATGLFALAKNLVKMISDHAISGLKTATAIYYDPDHMPELEKNFCHPVWMGDKVNRKIMSHVLLFQQDTDNLMFYEKMRDKIKAGSKVYIKLEEMDSSLLKESNVYYFNINEMIARVYWNQRNLQEYLKDGKLDMKIAIIGFDALGQKILNYGLMNNIYSLDQSIHYHVWGDSRLYRNLLGDFDKMNGDTITYHDTDWKDELETLRQFDRIIITSEVDIELLQTLLYLGGTMQIDFYNPLGLELPKVYIENHMTGFGVQKEVLTEKNIKTDQLYREAKKINYNYEVKYNEAGNNTWFRPDVEKVMEEKWNELSGFLKGSNVACADYHKIRLLVMETFGMDIENLNKEQEEMLAKMEHIRWSRFHFVNHWHWKETRDNKKRLHPLLVPYEQLADKEKQKDMSAIRELFEKRP